MALAPDLSTLEDRTPQGIAGAFSRAIRSGELAPGQRLPTLRDVAVELGVSPATVSGAWQALRRTGVVVSRGRAGTYVAEGTAATPWLSPRMQQLRGRDDDVDLPLDLSRGTPDPALLPGLAPALQRVSERAGTLAYTDEPVLSGLHSALLASWPHPVERLTVVDGATDGIGRLLDLLVHFGDRVVVESPGFPPFGDLLDALGAEPIPVELDSEGIRPDSLRRALNHRPVAVLWQPRAHNPTGVSTTPSRAEALAGVLRRAAAGRGGVAPWVIEDDHSGHISTAPDVSLGTWLPERVIHVRSYSKSHGPDLRIAALGGPASVVDTLVARRMLGPAWTSRMLQNILLDLLTSPTSRREVSAARRQYQARQRAIVKALARHDVTIRVPDGINVWFPVADERAALVHLAAAGIRAAAGSAFVIGDAPCAPHVRITTGLVPVEQARDVARAVAEAGGVGG